LVYTSAHPLLVYFLGYSHLIPVSIEGKLPAGGVPTPVYSKRGTMAKVLVIDDEPNVRTLLEILLREEGYDVLLANNGWKGLELYRHEHPDVILLDLSMPEIDGVTVLKEIRRIDLKQPVIIWTGDATSETERQVRALGVSEFIVKGSSMKHLVDTLKCLLTPPTLAMDGSAVK
jgi:two-component system, NtrC family, nitrogen regulation response regulator NtrX